MKFSGKTEINASLNDSFAAFADFQYFENHARRSGVEIARVDDLASPGPGMMWEMRIRFRDKFPRVQMELVDYTPPETLDFTARSGGMNMTMRVELIALAPRRTRAVVTLDVRASSLGARMLLNSARLTKGRLTRRFRQRVEKFGRLLEQRISSA